MLNLTQHRVTNEQVVSGVTEPGSFTKRQIAKLLTFDEIEDATGGEMTNRAVKIVDLCRDCESVLIGGAPYFMPYLVKALRENNIKPYYSFTKRVTEEKWVNDEDGEARVEKISHFKHIGFVEAF